MIERTDEVAEIAHDGDKRHAWAERTQKLCDLKRSFPDA